MNRVLLALAACAFAQGSASSLGCFVEYDYSSTTKNMCERAFHKFPIVSNVNACADVCVNDETCIMFAWELQSNKSQCRISSTCKEPTNALPGFQGYFRNSTAGKCATGAGETWTRVFLKDAAAKGAVCIDGSPGAYYIRTQNAAGVKADPNKWVLFMEGGGWTSSLQGSVGRAKTNLGSSKNYGVHPGGMEGTGMFTAPPFDTHTIVYAKYCDGGSFTGAMSNPPIVVGNDTIYFRGRGIFDGLFDDLLGNRGMDQAKELLYAGCSAGGLTAYIHADRVTATMKARAPAAKVVVLADAMYSLNHDDFQQDGHWPHFMSWVYHNMDATGASVNEACVTDMANKYGTPPGNRSEGWRCMFGTAVAPYLKTPTFILNSKYDLWQGAQIIGANAFKCTANISACPAPIKAFWVDYGNEMVQLLDALPARHGAYLHNCQSHCQTGLGPWTSDTVNGTYMGQAVATWYAAAMKGTQASVPRSIDRCDVEPCAPDICNGK
jgi:hypothetical protein